MSTTPRRERKYFDSVDFFLHGVQNPPHPQLLPVTEQKSAAQHYQRRGSKNKLFDSADWVMTGEIPEPANYIYSQ